ncbi:MAG: hypothetical protein JRF72_09620 [Deltaproteobacteria bacterium]|jgi:hypothetical protein|nr:hypothetical protein [Deltaproteobacteria bacterium]
MPEETKHKQLVERVRQLKSRRDELIALAPEKAMDRILEDPRALELVHSFPEQDFYLLVHDIGPEDALPLLSLASNRQWEHIVDLEAWQKDRVDIQSVTRWMSLMMEADPQRFMRWTLEEKLEFIEFYLFNNIEVRVREHDEDPADFGDDFFSLDGTYFVRFTGKPGDSESEKLIEKQRRQFIHEFTRRLSSIGHKIYQKMLLEAVHVIPAETEEECYRWRNVRLAEKGFLTFDEAIGIYQPLKPRDLKERLTDSEVVVERSGPAPAASQYPINLLKQDNDFTRALTTIDSDSILQQAQTEFANLCNQIIVADHKTVREREGLREIVKKACGYISIGLQRLQAEAQETAAQPAAALIKKYPLAHIFKVGFGGALELKWRTEQWVSQSWFADAGLQLTFWGEKWLGILGGLLIKKPLYHDDYETGVLYREFLSLAEIRDTENRLDQIKAVDDLFSLMNIRLGHPSSYGFLTYKNLILTLWARHYLNISTDILKPLTRKQFRPFFKDLLPQDPHLEPDQARRIPMAMKDSFVHWLTVDTGLKDYEITDKVGQTFEDLFNEIESEYGHVDAAHLDPRYIRLFLLEQNV